MKKSDGKLSEELRDVYREWFESIDRCDPTFVDKRMTADYTIVDLTGEAGTRESYRMLYGLIAPGYVGVHQIKEFRVREINPTNVLVRGTFYAEMKFVDGKEIAGTVRFSSVWTQEDSLWKCVLHHTSQLGETP